MTAPALPGAAPDPARLPPEVEREIDAVVKEAGMAYTGHVNALPNALLDLRTAIARALGGDGEPVACPDCAARKPDDGDWWARQVLKAKSLAALKSIAEGWPMSRPDVADEKGGDCG